MLRLDLTRDFGPPDSFGFFLLDATRFALDPLLPVLPFLASALSLARVSLPFAPWRDCVIYNTACLWDCLLVSVPPSI